MGEDAIFASGAFAEVKALAEFFAAGRARCSVNDEGIVFDWWAQTRRDWRSVAKGRAAAIATR